MNSLFVSACIDSVTAAKLYVSGCIFFWWGTPVMLCSQHSSFDSKPSTVMATRPHIKLVDVKGRFHMNILFVSVCVDNVTAAKLKPYQLLLRGSR